MKIINNAIIMAAGRGTRMLPLTKKIPKAMMTYKNSTLIANGIKYLKKNINNIHITVGHKGSILAKHVIENNVSTIINTDKKGNAWWIFNSFLKYLDEPVIVLTCDNVVNLDLKKIEKDYLKKNNPACMLIPVYPIKDLDGDYIEHSKNNVVTSLSRKKKAKTYCSGIQIINPYKINELFSKENDFNRLWKKMIKMKQLYVSDILPTKWFTTDNPKQLKILQNKKI